MKKEFRFFAWLNVFIVALFVILVISQSNKKFVLDEIDFPAVATTISKTGLPYEYRGEKEKRALGLWHPPLYAYSLGAFVKVFGSNENTVRAFGMSCTLISAILCILIYKVLFQATWRLINKFTAVFLPLFLLHPYTIANTTLPDIDSTILPVTILIFIYGLIRSSVSGNNNEPIEWSLKKTIFMSLLFSINLWAKLTTPLVLIPLLSAILYVRGLKLVKSLIVGINVAFLGGAFFLITYGLYCYLLTLPFDYTFKFLISSFTKNAAAGGAISEKLAGIINHFTYTKYFMNWLGLPFVFALTLACGSLLFKKNISKNETVLLTLAGLGFFVTIFYLGLTGAFGGFFKYPYATFPILMLVIAYFIQSSLFIKKFDSCSVKLIHQNIITEIKHNKIIVLLVMTIALPLLSYELIMVKDIVILKGNPVSFLNISIVMIAALLLSLYIARSKQNLLIAYGAAILFAVVVVTQFAVSRSQSVALYPTKYHYGQLGLDEAIWYLKSKLAPNEPIWCMKDIGHYVSSKYIENYGSIFKSQAQIEHDLDINIKNNGVRYLVLTTGIGQDRVDAYPELRLAMEACCTVDQIFGNFIIYKAKHHE